MKLNKIQLKYIALFTMTIDHIGYFLFPQYRFLRIIGRIAFPIFAYLCAISYDYTRNVTLYFLRVLIFAILTQVLFFISGVDFVNVMFTIALGIMAIYGYNNKHFLLVLISILLAYMLETDYSWYGVLMILGFYYFKDLKVQFLMVLVLTAIFQFSLIKFDFTSLMIVIKNSKYHFAYFAQFACLLSFIFIGMYENKYIVSSKFQKYLFYVFYPLHIVILKLISEVLI